MLNWLRLLVLRPALFSRNLQVQEKAAAKVGQLRSHAAAKALVLAMEEAINDGATDNEGFQTGERDWKTGHLVAALAAQGKIAVDPLIDALSSPSPHVRQGAAAALGRIGDKRAVPALSTALRHDKNWLVRSIAADALQQIGDRAAIPALSEALLRDQDDIVRSNAADALDKLRWEPPTLEQRVLFLVTRSRYEEAAKLGCPTLMPLLSKLLYERSRTMAVITALGQTGDPSAAELLVQAILSGGWKRQPVWKEKAVEAIARIGGPGLMHRLEGLVKNEDWDTASAAVKALAALCTTQAVELLGLALNPYDAGATRAASDALTRIGTARAKELLDANRAKRQRSK